MRRGVMHLAPPLVAIILSAVVISAGAADPAIPPGPQAPQPPPIPATADLLGWSHEFHPGAFFTSVYTSDDAGSSPDPTIQGSSSSISYRGVFDGALAWRGHTSALDQKLHLAYGRVRQSGSEWTENIDEVRYDGVYRRDIIDPTFVYRAWGLETVFTNPDNGNSFDPMRVYGSWGVGQLYQEWFPGDAFEWRLGIRLQKSWGSTLTEEQEDWLLGPEALLRYERTMDDLRSFFVMYEGWSEFGDLRHVTNIITGGVKMRFATYLAIELGVRLYYEARPSDLSTDSDEDQPAYSRWFVRQDVLIGIDAVF